MEERDLAASTEEVLGHHLQAFGGGDLEGLLDDYTDGSVIIAPDGVKRTREEMQAFFSAILAEFGKPGMSFTMEQQAVEGDVAYVRWTAETADNVYELGTDTFVVRDGKIAVQTFAAKTTPKI